MRGKTGLVGWIHFQPTPVAGRGTVQSEWLVVDDMCAAQWRLGALLLAAAEVVAREAVQEHVGRSTFFGRRRRFYLRNGYDYYKTQKAFRKGLVKGKEVRAGHGHSFKRESRTPVLSPSGVNARPLRMIRWVCDLRRMRWAGSTLSGALTKARGWPKYILITLDLCMLTDYRRGIPRNFSELLYLISRFLQ